MTEAVRYSVKTKWNGGEDTSMWQSILPIEEFRHWIETESVLIFMDDNEKEINRVSAKEFTEVNIAKV